MIGQGDFGTPGMLAERSKRSQQIPGVLFVTLAVGIEMRIARSRMNTPPRPECQKKRHLAMGV